MPINDILEFKLGERILIGYLLNNRDVLRDITTKIQSEYFSDPVCRSIYEIIIDNFDIDLALLVTQIGETLKDPDIIVDLTEFVKEATAIENIDIVKYIDRITSCYRRREGLRMLEESKDKFLSENADPTLTAADLISNFTVAQFTTDGLIEPVAYLKRRLEGLIKRKEHFQNVLTGFSVLDAYLTEGFSPGTTSVIAGRTSMGKTLIKRCIINNLCERGIGVLSFVPEMGFDRESDGMDALRTGRPLGDFYKTSQWDAKFHADVRDNATHIADNWNYVVQEDPFISFKSMERDTITMLKTHKIDVVFIDLFDRIDEIAAAGAQSVKVIKNLLNRQAALAKKYEIHFCNLVQIRRPDGKVKDLIEGNRPTIERIKDSGAYEEVTDLILLLFREGYYDKDVPDDQLEVIIGKQRVGPRFKSVLLDADWERVTVSDPIL